VPDVWERRLGRAFVAACGVLIAWLLWRDASADDMASREGVNVALGLWASRFLIAGLAIGPLAQALHMPRLKRLRRPLGVAAAVFAALHSLQYLAYSGVWPDELQLLWQRGYLLVGLLAVALLIPLAATSFNAAIRWLRPRRWSALHALVYPAVLLTVLHELMSRAPVVGEVGVHVLLAAGLLAWRLGRPVRIAILWSASCARRCAAAYRTRRS
jgi:sulfoxide reductase heme-binding subunit YedZ